MDYTTLKVGDQVAVARSGNWNIQNQGIYTVVKANKIKIVVQRNSDGYERSFSVKRGCEVGSDSRWESAFIEPVEEQKKRIAKREHEASIRMQWSKMESAVANKDLAALKALITELDALG